VSTRSLPQLEELVAPNRLVTPNGSVVPADEAADHLATISRYWRFVLAAMIIAIVAALVVSHFAPKRYDATAKVLVNASEPIDVVQAGASRSLDPERDLNTSAQLVSVDAVARPVRDALRLRMTVQQLAAEVSSAPEANSNLIAITVRDASPERAARIADTFATTYVNFRRDAARTQFGEAADLADLRLTALAGDPREAAQRRVLAQRRDDLRIAADLQTGGVRFVQPASVPTSAASPRTKLNVAIAAILGLLVGAGAAVVLARRH
jgi:uncharacterized protein involved in exopolysaccharide biosynthesis